MSQQLYDTNSRGLEPQEMPALASLPSGHSRQASFSRQGSVDVPTMSAPGRVAYGEIFPECWGCFDTPQMVQVTEPQMVLLLGLQQTIPCGL